MFFLFLSGSEAHATTVVPGGAVSGSVTWFSASSPYIVTGDLQVLQNSTLTVSAGCSVEFAGNWSITVTGNLTVDGAGGLVRFALAANASSSEWTGISGLAGSTLRFESVSISDALVGVRCVACLIGGFSNVSVWDTRATAIALEGVTGASLQAPFIQNASVGISLTNTSGIAISAGQLMNTSYGILAENATATLIEGFEISNSSEVGIVLGGSGQTTIRNGSIEGLVGVDVWMTGSATVTSVRFDVSWSLGVGIRVRAGSDGVWVKNASFAGFRGVYDFGGSNVEIADSTAAGVSWAAVEGVGCSGLRIVNLTATGGSNGILARSCSGVTVIGSLIRFTQIGIDLQDVTTCSILDSVFLNQSGAPIALSSSASCVIARNDILDGGAPPHSTLGSGNAWDDGSMGNYWEPHNYSDSDGDGIGDSPVAIPLGAEEDRYPAMRPFPGRAPIINLSGPPTSPEDVPFEVGASVFDWYGSVAAAWSVSCGGSVVNASGLSANLSAPDPGACAYGVTATNRLNSSATATATVEIEDTTPPVVGLSLTTTSAAGLTNVSIDLTGTFDNDARFPANASAVFLVVDPRGDTTTLPFGWPGGTFLVTLQGVYSVTATVSDAAGNAGTATRVFSAPDVTPPSVTLTPPTYVIPEDAPFLFGPVMATDDNLSFPANAMVRWVITLGGLELANASGWTATVTLNDPGRFNGSVVVCDAAGNCESVGFFVTVLDVTPPDLSQIPDFSFEAGVQGVLSAANATDNSPGWPSGAIFRWEIQLPDGNVSLLGREVALAIREPGVYAALLTVLDRAGNGASWPISITADDRAPPVLLVIYPRTAEVGESARFDASGSTDVSLPLQVYWNFGDGTAEVSGVAVSHSYRRAGNFEVVVRIVDAAGNKNETVLPVAASDTLPPALHLVAPAVGGGRPLFQSGERVDFEVAVDDFSTPVDVVWQFGDGEQGFGLQITHVYKEGGTTTVLVTATDAYGNTNSTEFDIEIVPPPLPPSSSGWLVAGVIAALVAATTILLWMSQRKRREPDAVRGSAAEEGAKANTREQGGERPPV